MKATLYLFPFLILSACSQKSSKNNSVSDSKFKSDDMITLNGTSVTVPIAVPENVAQNPNVPTPVIENPNGPTQELSLTGNSALSDQFSPNQLYTDLQLVNATSNNDNTYDVPFYWPTPTAGYAVINELSYTGAAGPVTYQIQRYTNAGKNGFYLEDYIINESGTQNWRDSWVYKVDSTQGVLEIIDTTPTSVANLQSYPLKHGKTLFKNTPFVNTAYGTLENHDGSVMGYFWNNYFIQLVDVKRQVTLPGGTFKDVVVQSEQQITQITTNGVSAPIETIRYRFYFAKGIGIIAIQWLDANWAPTQNPLLYLTKSCVVSADKYRCP
ncbi:MAG: hypothetical protein KA116_05695 [Proteobacteria bacterium]|nr:hypothetical protein [Pseudomonadota bacterium]